MTIKSRTHETGTTGSNPNYTAQFFVGVYVLATINDYLFKQR